MIALYSGPVTPKVATVVFWIGHTAARRLEHFATTIGIRMPVIYPQMLRHPFVTAMLRDVQIAARHADP
ncbi:hypothetical protein Aca07nite_86080 [Actinoplanes capillaceus]|uniref:Tyr recombinase domain-containing protein n=1 Tax=Actinoplanes campanulatus TaxID=113559 RepID=A0ABQ3WYV9_9ACTN|nr:hypothetical protein [Actinoplanes capillaceus]GID51333.1 hypothetical protein Aca07nite_86080 [Actinoplanes capillaceus]